MTSNRPTLDSFESALLTELRQHVIDHPAALPDGVTALAPRRRRRLRLAVSAAVGTAASVVAVVGIGTGGGSPAYAVEKDSHGDVVVTIHRLDDASGLESALKAKGIDADVSYDPDSDGSTAAELGSVGPGPALPVPGSGPSEGGLSQQQKGDGSGPVTSGAGPNADGTDPCGPIDPAPARLTHPGDDWVLTIPAGSPLQDRHVDIGTGPNGTLSVQYAGSQPGSMCGLMSVNSPASGTK
jgi:hypothetical protein